MTARDLYEAILIELNKENAPNILLEQFNYFANKSVNQYINKRYNIYDINQQTTDDLGVLKATALLTPTKCDAYGDLSRVGRTLDATYETMLPSDYLHILNCICIYKVNKTYKCYNKGDIWRRPATRLTADIYSQVLDNFWLRPTYKRPYYYIHNVNDGVDTINPPTDPRRLPKSASEFGEYNYYFGTIEPTSDNYLALLNEQSLDGLRTIGTTRQTYYALVPVDETITVMDKNQTASVVLEEVVVLGNYKKLKTVSNISGAQDDGQIYIRAKAARNNNEIGTDFKLGGLAKNYKNREISNIGADLSLGTDGYGNNIYRVAEGKGVPTSILLNSGNELVNSSFVERAAQVRYGNPSPKRLEIRYGTDSSLFELSLVYIDYIKAPQHIRLTQEQIDLTEDTSQVLEFPDYVCQEIVNELVHIIMENIGDPKLQTHPVVSQSIANPAQQQTEPVAQQQPT